MGSNAVAEWAGEVAELEYTCGEDDRGREKEGTSASEAALRWAAREAGLHDAQLHVVHAWQFHPSDVHDMVSPTAARARAQIRADGDLATWVNTIVPAAAASTSALPGGPLDRLLEAAAAADLVVVGRAPHHGLERLLHGHLADDLSLLIPCPVAVVPTSDVTR